MLLTRTFPILHFLLSFTALPAGEISVNLLAPSACPAPGAPIAVDLLWLNPGETARRVHPPVLIDAVLRTSTLEWAVHLHEAIPSDDSGELTVAAGGYVRRSYHFTPPVEARGTLWLLIERPFSAQALVDVGPPTVPAGASEEPPSAAPSTALRPVASRLHRTVVENFGFHEPIYFLYGPDDPAAKFQLSFRYRIVGQRESSALTDPANQGLYLAYTQRTLWNIKEPSSPFYDTSYQPELMFESLAADRPERPRRTEFIGYQAGYRHESNGRDGIDSRSLDILYLRTGLLIGLGDGWRVLVVPRIFAYLGSLSDNPDIADYRGYGELLLSVGREDGIQVNFTGLIGEAWDKGSLQLDATYPIKIQSLQFDTYLHLQYFSGYGESLRDYNLHTSAFRVGISLVR